MLRPATETERTRILAALPPTVHGPAYRGAVASVLIDEQASLLDGAVALDDPGAVWARLLVPPDAAGVDACLALLERRRAQLAHDASGPAMGVLAALETVLEYEPITDGTRALLEESRHGLLRLTRRLTDRGDALSRPNVVAGPLDALLARLAAPTIDALGHEGRLRVELCAGPDDVRIDAALIEAAIATLLSNAWAARRGHEVTVEIEGAVEGELLRISVRDDGGGLDHETALRVGGLGFAGRANGVGLSLFQLRRALARRRGVFLIHPLAAGARATVLLPASTSTSGP